VGGPLAGNLFYAVLVTLALLTLTRSEEFAAELKERVLGSSVLEHRWEIVEQALDARRRREYLLSIPPLLAQIEGVIADALVLKNLAVPVGHKLYARGADGELRREKMASRSS
jgi:hypothetical protein